MIASLELEAFLLVPLGVLMGGLLVFAIVAGSLRAKQTLAPRDGALFGGLQAFGSRGEPPLAPGKSLDVEIDGRPYSLTASDFGKYGPQSFWLGTYVTEALRPEEQPRIEGLPHAIVRLETDADRTGKILGLNRELETGVAAFDRAAYVETARASERDVAALLALPGVRDRVLALLGPGRSVAFNAEGHAIAVRYDRGGEPVDVAADLAGLRLLSEAIPPVFRLEIRPPAKPSVALVLIILFLCIAALVGMLFVLMEVTIIDPGVRLAALVASAIWIAPSVGLAWFSSRGRPRGYGRFVALALLALGFGPAVGAVSVVALDTLPDASREEAKVAVRRARAVKSGRSTKYYLEVEGWAGRAGPVELRVSASQYRAHARAKEVVLVTGKGWLGYAWLRSIEPA